MRKVSSRMKNKYVYYFVSLFLCYGVTSDWVEIPKLTQENKPNKRNHSSIIKYSTPVVSIFLETTTNGLLTNFSVKENFTDSFNINSFQANKFYNEIVVKKDELLTTTPKWTSKSTTVSTDGLKDFKNDPHELESNIIEETITNAKNDLLDKQHASIPEKLHYLYKLQNKMSAKIRQLNQGLWTERQARGKKLLGFASMEGALMTIAFLTFAVFLVKIVHQFIQSLQNQTLTMIMAQPTAPAVRLTSAQRQRRDLAAARLLQYMDEFSIKHRIHCD